LDGATFQAEPNFENLNFGDYTVTAINNAGCIGQLEVEVEDDNDLEVIVDERKNINCFYFDNGSIEFSVLGAEPPVTYALDGSIITSSVPSFDALSEGLHSVHIVDGRGCQEYLDFEIVRSFSSIDEDCPCVVYVPNAMTPDEDGVNDIFKVRPNAAERNGEYYAIDGVYFYKINYSWGDEFESTVNEVKTGNILVLR